MAWRAGLTSCGRDLEIGVADRDARETYAVLQCMALGRGWVGATVMLGELD